MEKGFPHGFRCGIESSDRIVMKSIHVWDGPQRVDLPVTSTSPEHMQPIYGHKLDVRYLCKRLCVLTTLDFLLMTFFTESWFRIKIPPKSFIASVNGGRVDGQTRGRRFFTRTMVSWANPGILRAAFTSM